MAFGRPLLVLALAAVVPELGVDSAKVETILEYISMRNCSGVSYNNFYRDVVLVRPSPRENYFTSEFWASESANITGIHSVLNRCRDRGAAECEYFMGYTVANPCKMMAEKGKPWSLAFSSTEPRFTCRIRKGVYKFNKCYLDPSEVIQNAHSVPGVTDFYWMGRFTYLVRKKDWACVEVVTKLTRVRS